MNQSLHLYFQQHADRIGHCYFVPVMEARPIKKEEEYEGGFAEIFERTAAPFDGFLVFTDYGPELLSKPIFHARYERIDQWLQKTPRTPIEDHIFTHAVKKGDPIRVHALERAQTITEINAPEDGWIVQDMNTKRVRFMNDLSFFSLYETSAPLPKSLENTYRPRHFDRSLKVPYVTVGKELLVRNSQNVPHNLQAGTFILQIPQSLPREYVYREAPVFHKQFTVTAPIGKTQSKENTVITVDFRSKKRSPK